MLEKILDESTVFLLSKSLPILFENTAFDKYNNSFVYFLMIRKKIR